MAFDIDDPETEALVLRFAALKGLSVDDAIILAVRNELALGSGSPAECRVSEPGPSTALAHPRLDPAES